MIDLDVRDGERRHFSVFKKVKTVKSCLDFTFRGQKMTSF